MQPLAIPDQRFHEWSLDFMTALPTTRKGNDSVLVFVDRFTKMVHLAPCKKTVTAEQSCALLMDHVIKLHGVPQTLVSDRDPRFTGSYWRSFCKARNIHLAFSTAAHPQTDGQTERSNKVVAEVLRACLASDVKGWEMLLPYVEFSINNCVQHSTKFSPFFLAYGLHPRTPVSTPADWSDLPLPSLVTAFDCIHEAVAMAKSNLRSAQDRQAYYANKGRKEHSFAAGQCVLLNSKNIRQVGKNKRKLFPKFLGPFMITEMIGKNAARQDLPSDWSIHPVFHVSLLRPYKGSPPADKKDIYTDLQLVNGEPVSHTVLHIKSHKVSKRLGTQYLVQWAESPQESYVSPECLPHDMLQAYWTAQDLAASS